MKPSSIACFMEYRSKATFFPSSFRQPNSCKVVGFGVAVKAIMETLGCFPLRAISSSMISPIDFSSSDTSTGVASLSLRLSERAYVTASMAVPAVEEWASSMITAKVLLFSSCTNSWMYMNLWMVVTMIFVLPLRASARSLDVHFSSMTLISPALCSSDSTAFWSWRSTTIRSVMMQTVSKMTLFSLSCKEARRCASHAMVLVLPLPAECSIR